MAQPPPWVRSWRENPELLNLKLKAQRAKLASVFNPFFEHLHVPPAEQEQLLDIALRAEEQKMDVDAAISEGRLTYADAAVGKLLQKIRADYQSSARTLLGDTAYEAFRAFDRTRQLRESLNSLIGNAASRGTPLSREDAEAFITVVAESAKNSNADNPIYPTDVDWDKVEARASDVLSAAQVNSLMRYDPMGFGTAGPLFARFNQLINEGAAQDRAAEPSTPNG
ncbi:MAG TPA: hypothetical protein VFT72_01260 [Opitutaceae bacterium]|nr:hypothetical protein [Opitutaceae bacterium]